MKILIITPTLNERATITAHVRTFFSHYPGYYLLIVDDSSADGTGEIVIGLQKEFANLFLLTKSSDSGYSRAILSGLRYGLENKFDVMISMDVDGSHPYEAVADLAKLVSDSDKTIGVGSRWTNGGGVRNWAFHRILLSRFANIYVRSILRLNISDATAGFVAYSRGAVETLLSANLKSEGYSFLVETKYLLKNSGFTFRERPIIFTDRTEGESKMSGRKIWESIWMPWRLLFS